MAPAGDLYENPDKIGLAKPKKRSFLPKLLGYFQVSWGDRHTALTANEPGVYGEY